jgi:hypothetical protein
MVGCVIPVPPPPPPHPTARAHTTAPLTPAHVRIMARLHTTRLARPQVQTAPVRDSPAAGIVRRGALLDYRYIRTTGPRRPLSVMVYVPVASASRITRLRLRTRRAGSFPFWLDPLNRRAGKKRACRGRSVREPRCFSRVADPGSAGLLPPGVHPTHLFPGICNALETPVSRPRGITGLPGAGSRGWRAHAQAAAEHSNTVHPRMRSPFFRTLSESPLR